MLRLFLDSQAHLAALTFRLIFPGRCKARVSAKRRSITLPFILAFGLVQLIHWIGFLLDELLFPAYRRIQIREPLFVLGVPRSGTTHLHRVLAKDEGYTTFSTWECLFALSITARRFWLGLAALDRSVGGPLGKVVGWLEARLFKGLAEVHSMRLDDPEEDYFALMPVLACFILILPFPHSERLWRMGAFDRDMPEPQRQRIMDFYRRCLQKHLYVHGPDKRLLSKNAAFAPLAGSLAETFRDARFLVCLREPEKTFPSQLSSIESGIAFFDSLTQTPDLRERLTEQLGFYYRNLDRVFATAPENRCVWVTMETLSANLSEAIEHLYARLDLDLTPAFRQRLTEQESKARGYRSGHRYHLGQYGLSRDQLDLALGGLYGTLAARAIQI